MTKQYYSYGERYMDSAHEKGANCVHCGLQTYIIMVNSQWVLTWCIGCGSILRNNSSGNYSIIMTPYISVDADKHQPSEQ